jgi:hypothetical protein
VPEGVSAFSAVAVDGSNVELVRVADKVDGTAHGAVIPARTPVILYIEDDDKVPSSSASFAFEYTTEDATLLPDVQASLEESKIYGRILKTAIACDDGYRYYKLASKSGDDVSKMYWMYKEYSANGTIAAGNAGTDKGGHISCSANKIYMRIAESTASNSFSMRFAGVTTGIDEVETEDGEVETIFDMQGRKLNKITKPGCYIVNGKKVIVK